MSDQKADSVKSQARRNSNMLIPTIILGVIAAVLLFIGFRNGQEQHIAGTKAALVMLIEVLPMLLFAFIIAAMVQLLLPQELINKWVGSESGMRGILLGSLAGGFTPGGPFVSLPVAVGLIRSGAGVGTMVAFLTSWALIAISRLPMEIGILGWRLSLIRLGCTFFFAPIAGLLAQLLFCHVKI
jgi:uncharacterized membrane protein YraQ (UPF0718 family)